MAKFVWIASYPKSGNTWVRFLIANLLLRKVETSAQVMQQVPDIHDDDQRRRAQQRFLPLMREFGYA